VDLVLLGDTHRCPSDPQEADDVLLAIGDYINDAAPQFAVHLGDLGDFRTLNGYKGGAIMGGDGSDEGHDLLGDVAVWETGLRLLQSRWKQEARRHQRARHNERTPDIQWFFCEGNHEEMLRRFALRYPGLRSLIRLDRLDLAGIAEREGWEWMPFLSPLSINGLTLQHYFQGLNPKQALAIQTVQSRNGASSAFGHTHSLDVRHWKDAHGRRRTVINTGCTKHPSRLRRYEDSGILHIKGLHNGEFTYEWLPTDQLIRRYRAKTRGCRR
uniref:metallophosphoesterase n=1 Tax=Paracoccus sp. SSK6 TaxID=3143131 RepID=UPI003218EA5F